MRRRTARCCEGGRLTEGISPEEAAARRWRLKVIIAVGVALVLLIRGFLFYVDRRADQAQEDLRARLAAVRADIDHAEVLDDWYGFLADPDDPGALGSLPTANRIAVRAEGETVIAVYKAGFAGEDRCYDLVVAPDETTIRSRGC